MTCSMKNSKRKEWNRKGKRSKSSREKPLTRDSGKRSTEGKCRKKEAKPKSSDRKSRKKDRRGKKSRERLESKKGL